MNDYLPTIMASLTGLICLELYKILQNKDVTQLRNTFSNLALPLFTSMEPEPPKVTTSVVRQRPWKWTQVESSSRCK